jgi:hypothetical protein
MDSARFGMIPSARTSPSGSATATAIVSAWTSRPINRTLHIRSFFDGDGNLKPIQDLTEEQGAVLASLEVIIKNAKAGDGVTDTVHKFKLWDKTRALEALAKHFGLVTERLEVSGWDKLAAQLNHARTVGPTAST